MKVMKHLETVKRAPVYGLLTQFKLLGAAKYQFCSETPQKTQEISTINPLVQSLSETELFQTIQPAPSSKPRHSDIEAIKWRNKNRKRVIAPDSHHYSAILNARSVDDIRNQLQIFKDNYDNNSREQTLNLVESLTTDTAIDTIKTNNYKQKHILSEAYRKAIEITVCLKEFDEGFKIFEEAKQNKAIISPNIFAAAIDLQMEQNFTQDSLNKCFAIRNEMEEKYKMRTSARIYQQLITNAINLKQFNRAGGMVKLIMNLESSEKERLLREDNGKHLRIAIIRCYSTRKQIHNGLEFMNYLVKTFGHNTLDDYIYSSMLSGIAHVVQDGDDSMVEAGETLFSQSFQVLGRAPKESVFLSLMNMYAYVPDYKSCIDVLQHMLSCDNWPNPTTLSYSVCLKAVNQYGLWKEKVNEDNVLKGENGWKCVDDILELMKKHNETPHTAIYSLLFNLCSGMFNGKPDLERMYKYYDEMLEQNLALNPSAAHNLLLCGIDYYMYEIKQNMDAKETLKEDCMKFVEWALAQYKRHNIELIRYHQHNLERKLNDINAL